MPILSMEPNDGSGDGFEGLGGKSSRVFINGCGEVGGVVKSSIGSSFGDFGGEGDFDDGSGAGGGVVGVGVFVGGGVSTFGRMWCGGVGVVRFKKFSSLMGDDIVIGEESDDDEASLAKQQGFTLILAVFLKDLGGDEDVFDFVIVGGF